MSSKVIVLFGCYGVFFVNTHHATGKLRIQKGVSSVRLVNLPMNTLSKLVRGESNQRISISGIRKYTEKTWQLPERFSEK